MKKKGFTLIELAAVIMILGIIMLIAVPIVLNTIENSKKGAAERSAESYLHTVEVTVAWEKTAREIQDGEYTIQEDGSLCLDNECTDENKIAITMSGNKPSSGTIKIENASVVPEGATMTIGDYSVSYDSVKKSYVATKEASSANESYICEKTGAASKTVGAQYTCHLDTDRTFYVLENIESSENISLIMDRNFTDGIVQSTLAWCTDGGNDNTTCQNINSKESNPLKHIQDTFGNNVTVSFPTKDQIVSANNGSTTNLPQWLYDYLDDSTFTSWVRGYWTASPDEDAYYARFVYYIGHVSLRNPVDDRYYYGVRPVITISKSLIN